MIYLIIEFIDELVFGVGEAAWPLIHTDLQLNYVQIGLTAQAYGLQTAMWLLLAGPIALLVGLPRKKITATSES